MRALVTPQWWWVMAAWLQNKADFCVHVANEIEAKSQPQDPEDTSDRARYMTHNVHRVELPNGDTKVTGWCTGCDPDNCCGCAHIETPVVPSYEPGEGS